MGSIFVSSASATKATAERVAEALRAIGYEVWRDDALPPHRPYTDVIEERLRDASAVVVIWSKAATESQWVRAEANLARQDGKLVQLRIDDARLPLPFPQIQCANLIGWKGDPDHSEWRKVAASVAELMGRPDAAASGSAVRPRASRPVAWGLAALAALIIAGAGLWALRDRLPFAGQGPQRVAVLPFTVEGGDASLQGFADGLLDETLGALSSLHLPAVPRQESLALRGPRADETAKRLGVTLLLDGAVKKVGDKIRVRLYLNDARDHATLWSTDIERPAVEADAMQAQVAARATDVAHSALVARSQGAALDAAGVADYVEAVDEMDNGGTRIETLMRELLAKAPNFSHAHSLLALMARAAPGQSPADLMAFKRAEANKALQLDPHNGEAYTFLGIATPRNAWAKRDALYAKGAGADPTFAPLFHFQSKFFSETGRFHDALDAAEKAAALNNMFPGGGVSACIRRTNLGLFADARPICERADKLWPEDDGYNNQSQFFLQLENGREADALARLSRSPDLAARFTAPGAAAWTTFLEARAAHDATAARAAAVAAGAAADAGAIDRRIAYLQLAMTGQVDAALAQAQRYYRPEVLQQISGDDWMDGTLLFVTATAPVRRDPRFMAIAAQMGLVDYWRTSGRWPDFCAEPGLPYDCKAEAAKLAGRKG